MNKPITGVKFCQEYMPELELQSINILNFTAIEKFVTAIYIHTYSV